MHRSAVLFVVLALVVAGSAFAARGDPQKHIKPADQARARAMLIRKADLGLAFRALPSNPDQGDFYCKALDESDLTLTGDAESPDFQGATTFVSAEAEIYESVADANTSWRRGTSPAGETCIRSLFKSEFAKGAVRFLSFRRLQFPHVIQKTIAYRLVASSQGVRIFFDVLVLQQGRAQVSIAIGAGLIPPPNDEEVRLARLTSRRIVKAMQGA
jgi:hypothetical protein